MMDIFIPNVLAVSITYAIFMIIAGSTGLYGAPAYSKTLSILGLDFGMKHGIITISLISLIIRAISKYIIFRIYLLVLNRQNLTEKELFAKVGNYHISNDFKIKLKMNINNDLATFSK